MTQSAISLTRRKYFTSLSSIICFGTSALFFFKEKKVDNPEFNKTPANIKTFNSMLGKEIPRPIGFDQLSWQYSNAKTNELIKSDNANLFLNKSPNEELSIDLRVKYFDKIANRLESTQTNAFSEAKLVVNNISGSFLNTKNISAGGLNFTLPALHSFGFIVSKIIVNADNSKSVFIDIYSIPNSVIENYKLVKNHNSNNNFLAGGMLIPAIGLLASFLDNNERIKNYYNTTEGRLYLEQLELKKVTRRDFFSILKSKKSTKTSRSL